MDMGNLDGTRELLETMRPALKARQRREKEVVRRLFRDGFRGVTFYTSACPVQLEGRLPSGEAFYFRARGKAARLDISTKEGTPEAACKAPAWSMRVERWEWPHAGWLEPVATEALLRELLTAYRSGRPSETAAHALEPEVLAMLAEARSQQAVVITLDRQLLVRGEGITPEDALKRFAAEEARKANALVRDAPTAP